VLLPVLDKVYAVKSPFVVKHVEAFQLLLLLMFDANFELGDLVRQLFVAEILCVPFRYFVMFKQRPKIHLIRNNSDKKCLH